MDVDIERLKYFQEELSKQLVLKDKLDKDKIRTIAGCYTSFKDNNLICAIVTLGYKTLNIIEEKVSTLKSTMDHIPGYSSFRYGPVFLKVYRMLKQKPDILMFNGNGILHPQKIGIASHMGILFNIITIGVAKSLLLGEIKENMVFVDDEQRAVKINENSDPLYVSPGHNICLETSVEIVRYCLKENKLPEPIRLALNLADKHKKDIA
jgi:deoxyribonuclease V